MTSKQILVWAVVVSVAVGMLLTVALDWVFVGDRDSDGIPVPPPGYQYCSNGEQIKFCPRPGGEWK